MTADERRELWAMARAIGEEHGYGLYRGWYAQAPAEIRLRLRCIFEELGELTSPRVVGISGAGSH